MSPATKLEDASERKAGTSVRISDVALEGKRGSFFRFLLWFSKPHILEKYATCHQVTPRYWPLNKVRSMCAQF